MSGLGDIVEMTAETDEERNLLHHVRGNCHNSAACPLCKAQNEAYAHRIRIESIITGSPLPDWVVQNHPVDGVDRRPPMKPLPLPLADAIRAFDAAFPQEEPKQWDGIKRTARLRTLRWMREKSIKNGLYVGEPSMDSIAAHWLEEFDALGDAEREGTI